MGGRSMKDVGGAVLAGSTPPFLGRERAAVDVDVGPERRSPRYHETCLALESVKESSAAVSTCKPRASARGAWLRMPIVKNLEEARRLPVRVEEQQPAMIERPTAIAGRALDKPLRITLGDIWSIADMIHISADFARLICYLIIIFISLCKKLSMLEVFMMI